MKLKDALRKIVPLRTSTFLQSREAQEAMLNSLSQRIDSLSQRIDSLSRQVDSSSHTVELLTKTAKGIQYDARCGLEATRTSLKSIHELLWSDIFNQTKAGSEWLSAVSLSPGRWAVGYQFLYVLYRILDEIRPQNILELGLGESTVMTSSYARHEANVSHDVIEHDEDWIDFFCQSNSLADNTKINISQLEMVDLSGCSHKVRAYSEFAHIVANKRYSLILIDGPFGAEMEEYSRIDVLQLVPDHLESSFVILFDDYNREPEQRTAKRLLILLDDAGIAHAEGLYAGDKTTLLICSADLKFLTTM